MMWPLTSKGWNVSGAPAGCPHRRAARHHLPFSALVEALGPVLTPSLDRPYALFGYRLGTYFFCLELAR